MFSVFGALSRKPQGRLRGRRAPGGLEDGEAGARGTLTAAPGTELGRPRLGLPGRGDQADCRSPGCGRSFKGSWQRLHKSADGSIQVPGPWSDAWEASVFLAIQRLFLNISVQHLQISFLEGLLSVVVYYGEE